MASSKKSSYIEKSANRGRKKPYKWVKRIFIGILCAVILFLLIMGGLALALPKIFKTPNLDTLLKEKPLQITRVYSDTNVVVGEFAKEKRIPVSLSKIPKDLRNAIVAVEDKNFYKHKGIDPSGIARAMWINLQKGRIAQGASTIPQQLSRILYLSRDKTYRRKIQEMLIALQVSRKYSKDQILELYLNHIYLGHGTYGVEVASNFYFGKTVDKLNLAESALIAGLPQRPEVYSPFRNMKNARQRRAQVLDRMVEEGYITKKQADRAKLAPIHLSKKREQFTTASYFVEEVRRRMVEDPNYGYSALYQEGLRIYTTMNNEYQKAAQEILRAHLVLFEKNKQDRWNAAVKNKKYKLEPKVKAYAKITKVVSPTQLQVTVSGTPAKLNLPEDLPYLKPENIIKVNNFLPVMILGLDLKRQPILQYIPEPHVQGALIALDPKNGQIKAMVGGYDFQESEYNRAIQAYRQPGSAFKPIVYAAAIDNNFAPSDLIQDESVSYSAGEDKNWTPQNYDRKFRGIINLRYALENSINVPTVKLAARLGIDRVIEYAHRLGIQDTKNRKLNRDLTLALGSMEVSPLELSAAFAVFANGGTWYQPEFMRYITDTKGTKVDEYQIFGQDVLSPQVCYILTDMLKGVIVKGTAGYSVGQYFHRPAAGKTGTTSDYSDAWFIGYTPDLVVCTWIGYDKRQPLGYAQTGGMVAAPIWRDFMLRVLDDTPATDFPVPDGIVFADVCSASGKLATAQCFEAVYQLENDGDTTNDYKIKITKEVFRSGLEPKESCTSNHNLAEITVAPPVIDAEAPIDLEAPSEEE